MTVHPIPIQAGEDVVRIGRALVHRATLAGATAALLLAPLPMPLLAKAPGVSHCYKGVCHRVRTVGQTRAIVGRTQTIETSYYDIPGVDRFNTGTYTSNGERFNANDPARVASANFPDGTELLALFVHAKDRRWVAWTPRGYYMASPGGDDLIGWHQNRGWGQAAGFAFAAERREQFRRPDIVRRVFQVMDEDQAVEDQGK